MTEHAVDYLHDKLDEEKKKKPRRSRYVESELMHAAVKWWKNCRPCYYTKADHIANPEVNQSTDSQRRLARAVAAYVALGK